MREGAPHTNSHAEPLAEEESKRAGARRERGRGRKIPRETPNDHHSGGVPVAYTTKRRATLTAGAARGRGAASGLPQSAALARSPGVADSATWRRRLAQRCEKAGGTVGPTSVWRGGGHALRNRARRRERTAKRISPAGG